MGKRSKRTPGKKYPGVTLTCAACGDDTQRVSSVQRFCPKASCQAVSKRGTSRLRPTVMMDCRVCKKTVVRKNKIQVRCGAEKCRNAEKRKTTVLGRIMCPFCKRRVKRRHPWQKCCGTKECRNALVKANKAPSRKHFGKTFTCDECGQEAPRTRSNQRFCTSEHCQHVSKFGKPKPKVELTCPHCATTVVRRNSRQRTCGAAQCKLKRDKEMLLRREPPKRKGRSIKCRFCREPFTKLSSIHVTCNSDECAKKQKAASADESYWLKLRREPKLCGVCTRPIRVKRFKYHTDCRKQLATDKRRISVEVKRKLTADKVLAFRNSRPKRGPRKKPRMEELKCARQQLQRTS